MTTHPGPRGAETIRPTGTTAAEAIARRACPCTCHDDYTKRGLVAPDCAWHSGGGQDIIDALIDAGWTLTPPAGPYRPGGYTPGPPIPHHLAAPMPGEPVITPDQARRIGPAAIQAARAQIAPPAPLVLATAADRDTWAARDDLPAVVPVRDGDGRWWLARRRVGGTWSALTWSEDLRRGIDRFADLDAVPLPITVHDTGGQP